MDDTIKALQPSRDISSLLRILKALRSPQGCPWDKSQTYESLVPYTLEEAYEVADSIASGQGYKICEELGDLLLQIVFYCEIAEEKGEFEFGDVVLSIGEKLIRRHPHVFRGQKVETPEEVNELWDGIKAREVGSDVGPTVPPLPGLLLLQKLASRVSVNSVENSEISQILDLVQQTSRDNRCLEAEVRRFCAKLVITGRISTKDGE